MTQDRILNVDDREVNRYLRSQTLKAAGFLVTEASSGAEALARFEEVRPSLVLLDVNLPDMSGMEVCRRIKSLPSNVTVLVLHISATAIGTGSQVLGLEGGADGYLAEPVEPEVLVAHVRSLLRLRRAEQQLYESEERFRTIFAEAPTGILLIDPDLGIRELNSSAAAMLDVAPGHAAGLTLGQLLHPDQMEYDLTQIGRLFAGEAGRYQAETRLLRRSGKTLEVRMTLSVVRDRQGQPRHAIALLEDITQTKSTKLALMRSYEELNQFAYAASHDLQEPLRTIASHAELLSRRCRGRLDEDADQLISYIVAGTLRLQTLIRDLLALAQLQSGTDTPRSATDITAALLTARSMLQAAVEESGASITAHDLPMVMADSGLLVQLFQNLIANAVKYRREGVAPEIQVFAERQGDEWALAVRDNGIGFDGKYADRIFGVFTRLHGREIAGTGIGLALCKRIVERLGGRIWAESQPGIGSTFWFTLEAMPESARLFGKSF